MLSTNKNTENAAPMSDGVQLVKEPNNESKD